MLAARNVGSNEIPTSPRSRELVKTEETIKNCEEIVCLVKGHFWKEGIEAGGRELEKKLVELERKSIVLQREIKNKRKLEEMKKNIEELTKSLKSMEKPVQISF